MIANKNDVIINNVDQVNKQEILISEFTKMTIVYYTSN